MRKYFALFLQLFLILIIIFEIGFVVLESTLRPVMQFDALSNWAWKAKVLFYQPYEFFNKTSDLFLGGGSAHPNYPFFLPMIMAGIYYLFGNVDDALVGLLFALHFVILIVFMYISLRWFVSRSRSLLFTAMLSTIPLLSYHGLSAYADLPLTLYFSIAALFLFKYMSVSQSRKSDLVVAGIFAGLITWIKLEGLMLSAVLFMVFILYVWRTNYRSLTSIGKQCAFFVGPFLILFLPWFVFKLYFGLSYSNVDGPLFTGFHPEVVINFFQQVFISNSFHLWPGIFLIMLLFKARKAFSYPYTYILFMIFGVISAYLIIYVFTPSYEFALDGTVIGRNMLTIVPLSIFFAGLLLSGKKSGELYMFLDEM
ncbi:glycosyltransferase family 39 protein [Patescibacteria group bacterium AH-259-L07]|nr:glycosyltransferase family 39 protein [Patescibacteria group bacterium AH-259-L07]